MRAYGTSPSPQSRVISAAASAFR
ncbi:MAG: hypothetical protein H6Q10_3664, partial [Acidobacteria bacterium]|nr:hypothetical protein [Acidobacteriota bacterium]